MEKEFNKDSVKHFSSIIEFDKKVELSSEASIIVGYLKKVYEDEIKKEISKNYNAKKVTVKLPKKIRKIFKGKNNNDCDVIEQIVQQEFKALGFDLTLDMTSCACILDSLCNGSKTYAIIKWI